MTLRRVFIVTISFVLLALAHMNSRAVSGTVVINPPMPCSYGVRGNFTTYHELNSVYSAQRSAYDIRCGTTGGSNGTDTRMFSPTTGKVSKLFSNSKPSKRGMFIEDTTYGGCFVVWHITATVSVGQIIEIGTLLGNATGAGGHAHFAWLDMSCAATNGAYSSNVMKRERPVQWREIGYVLPRRIVVGQMGNYSYISQNPANAPVTPTPTPTTPVGPTPTPIPPTPTVPAPLTFAADGYSQIAITTTEVRLTVTASNLPGRITYGILYRDAAMGYPAKIWRYQINATTTSVTFTDMEGLGDTFAGVRYYTVVSLNPISDSDASAKRTACATATNYRQFCDSKIR